MNFRDAILFNGHYYPVRQLFLAKDKSEVLLSTTQLNKVIFEANGSYVSAEAENVDNQIFYYLDEKEFLMNDRQLNLLLSHIA